MKRVIRLGDPTTHGGKVVSAASNCNIFDKPVARLGDKVVCPLPGHGMASIVEGDPTWMIDGKNVALDGHKCSCGCSLISTLGNLERSYEGVGTAFTGGVSAVVVAEAAKESVASSDQNQYDEQLLFLSEEGEPYANLDYVLTLEDGSSVSGRTDWQGNTERVVTKMPMEILHAEFFLGEMRCCEKHLEQSDKAGPAQAVKLSGVKTNDKNVGSSKVKVTPEDTSRKLTDGEIAMAKKVFKEGINYGIVKVCKRAYSIFQKDGVAMSPDGNLYFKPMDYRPDFSNLDAELKTWFIHELAHVWQYQLGYNVEWNGFKIGLSGGYVGEGSAYKYDIKSKNTKLSDYNMEQQAEFISHYFAASVLQSERYKNRLEFLSQVLSNFLNNPKDASLLPK